MPVTTLLAGASSAYTAPETSMPSELPNLAQIGANSKPLPPAPMPAPLPSARKPFPPMEMVQPNQPTLRLTVPNIDQAHQQRVIAMPLEDHGRQQAQGNGQGLPSLAPLGNQGNSASQGGLVKALFSTLDATQAAVTAVVPAQLPPIKAMPLQSASIAPSLPIQQVVPVQQAVLVPELPPIQAVAPAVPVQQQAVIAVPLPADAPQVEGLKQYVENGELKTTYQSPGIILKKETVVAPVPAGVQRPAPTLAEHMAALVPQVAQETLEHARRSVTVYADASAELYGNMAPAAGVQPASASPDAPLIELPPADAPAATPAAKAPAVAPAPAYVAVPLTGQAAATAVAPAPAPAAPIQPNYVAVPMPASQIAPAKPAAQPAVAAEQGFIPAPPEVVQDTIVPQGPASAMVDLYGADNAPIVPTQPVRELSEESKAILSKLPNNIEKKQRTGTQAVTIERATPTAPINANVGTVRHEAMGINIEVKAQKMNVNEELRKAYDAQNIGQSSTAIQLYRNVLENEPDNKQALLGLAIAYHRAGQIDKARMYYGKVLAQDPRNREALNNFMLLLAEEAPDEALSQLQSLENRNPDSSSIPAQMAVIYQRLNQPDLAMEKMLRAMQIAPENLTYRYNLAILLDRQKRYEEAAQLYQHLLAAQDRGEIIPGNVQKIQQRLTFIRSNKS